MAGDSLEKGWGGYSTFRPMRHAEVDEESIDVEEEWEEPESLEGMDPEEAFGYGWVKAAEMMQERLDELMALPDEEDVDDLAKTAGGQVSVKVRGATWTVTIKNLHDVNIEGPGVDEYGSISRKGELEDFTEVPDKVLDVLEAHIKQNARKIRLAKTASEPDGRGMTEKLKVKLPNVNGLWSEVALGYHPSGTMEIYLDTRKNIDFGFSIYVNRRWGGYRIGDFEKIIRELKKGKMPRGFFLDAGAKFDHVPTKRAAKLPQAENFAYTIPVEDRGNSSEEIFLKEPRYYETREFAESKVLGNDPSVDKGDQATGKPVPPTPTEILETTPGSKELSTFSRYLIQTDHDVKGVPEHRDDVEKHPDLVQEQDEEAEASKKTASLMDEFKRVKGLAEKLPDNDFLTSVLKQISEGHSISPKQEAVIEKIKGQVGDMTKMQEQLKSMKHKKAFAGWTLTKFSQRS